MRTTAIDGVLLVDKSAGVTSHDVVAIARRALRTRRVGHTGTLDPFATGLLVLLVGRGTRLAPYVDGEPKVYDATIAFGAETTTDDFTGEITREADRPSSADVDRAMESLTGAIVQRPPDYSAKQVAGRRAYAAARAGTPLALEPVPVVVHEWRVRHRGPAQLEVTIVCAGGTYVRALARDLGRAAGSAAHLTALRRTRSGPFDVAQAVSVADLEVRGAHALAPLRLAISHLPAQILTEDELQRVRHGNIVDARVDAPVAALIDLEGNLAGIARHEGGVLQPRVVMHDD
jgi:tRNA pseudouridine55 synthase